MYSNRKERIFFKLLGKKATTFRTIAQKHALKEGILPEDFKNYKIIRIQVGFHSEESISFVKDRIL